VNGIDDRYVSLGYLAKGVGVLDSVTAIVVYRDLQSERLYEGETPALYQDTSKFWAQLEYVW
jgi:hypothetical protein